MASNDDLMSLMRQSLLLQVLLLAVVAVALWWTSPDTVGPAVVGGLVALVAHLTSGVVALVGRRGAAAAMAALVLAEVVKFTVVVLGFALSFWVFADRLAGHGALALIGTFGVTLGAPYVVPLASGLNRSER